jgi:hypothetical protein
MHAQAFPENSASVGTESPHSHHSIDDLFQNSLSSRGSRD